MNVVTDTGTSRLSSSIMAISLSAIATSWAMDAAHADVTNDSGQAFRLEEVIVTAQRRQENLQAVPISVANIPADMLSNAGIDATISIPELVPSVQLVRSGPSAMFFVRGVGNTSGGTGEEGANAFYLDGVYLADLKGSVLKFNNIERIEVLKGPQGTLFGRNSSGGLVNVITKEPGDEVEFKADIGYGNYETYSTQLYAASPISDNISADIAVTFTDQKEGWGESVTTGRDVASGWDWGVRSKWVWRPSPTAKITLAGDYVKMDDDFTSSFRTSPGAVAIGGVAALRDPYDTHSATHTYTKQRNAGLTLTGEFDYDWATLTSITGYRANKTETALDPDTIATELLKINIDSSTTTLQQEFRLSSNDTEPFSWQTGLFFLDAEAELDPQQLTGLALGGVGVGNAVFSKADTRSYAIFGEVGYAIMPMTQITAGVRYTRDKRSLDAERILVGRAGPVTGRSTSVSDEEVTYRLAIRQELTDDMSVYASYNRGFKAGTYSMSAFENDSVKPQTIDAFEVGIKSEWFDRRLRLNGAAFYYEIEDYQVRAAPGVGADTILLNAADVEIKGLEIEVEALPANNLTIFANASFLDSKFKTFPFSPFTYPNPGICVSTEKTPGVVTGAPNGGSFSCLGDASGNRTPLAPKFSGSVGATYILPMGEMGEFRMSGLYSYNDGFYFEPDNRLEQPSYGLLNGSVAYRSNDKWGLELWGRNLNNKVYHVQMVGSAVTDFAVPAAPRTFGITFSYEY